MKGRWTIRRKRVLGLIGFVAAVGLLSLWTLGRDQNSADAYLTASVERATIHNSVSAAGSLQAVQTVQVGSQISGQVQALYADFNDRVVQGQLLATIDPRTFESQLVTAEARLLAAQAKVRSAEADLLSQQSNLLNAEANLVATLVSVETAQTASKRAWQLADQGLMSASEYDVIRGNADSATARATQAEASVGQARALIQAKEAQLDQAEAEVVQAEADLERDLINLELTNIYSPADGVVISRDVDVGQTVAASLQAPTLFVIAADLTAMQVNASIDEADVGKIVEDAVVEFTVDAYPNDVFRGTIQEIRLDPQSVQNVVTYNAIVGVDNPELKLKPGMTANVAVTIQRSDDVLAVPNAALRYAPTSLPEPDVSRPTGVNSEGRGSATPERERTRPSAGTERGTVWVLDVSDELQANRVVLGITDGVWTELLMSDLEEGEEVIVGELAGTATASNARTGGAPFNLGAAPQGRGLR